MNAKNHEYVSEKDNTAVERGLTRIATALGLNKPLSSEEAEYVNDARASCCCPLVSALC